MKNSNSPFRDFSQKAHHGSNSPVFSWSLLSPRQWPQWLGLALLSLLWLLPITWRDGLGKSLGKQMAKGRWPRRIPENLGSCFSGMSELQKKAVVLEYCQAQACVILDLPALWLSSPAQLRKRVKINGLENLESEYAAGRPVCLLVCHSLGMEHAGRTLKDSYPILGYYQPFGSPVIDWLFYRYRSRNGGYLLQRKDSLRPLVRDLRDAWMLYMMIDEDMGETEGHWVPFFETAKCAIKAPAKLTAMAGASAVPLYSWYNLQEHRYEIDILPALANFPCGSSREDVAQLMATLETMIEFRVAQYGWRQQLFRSRTKRKA